MQEVGCPAAAWEDGDAIREPACEQVPGLAADLTDNKSQAGATSAVAAAEESMRQQNELQLSVLRAQMAQEIAELKRQLHDALWTVPADDAAAQQLTAMAAEVGAITRVRDAAAQREAQVTAENEQLLQQLREAERKLTGLRAAELGAGCGRCEDAGADS